MVCVLLPRLPLCYQSGRFKPREASLTPVSVDLSLCLGISTQGCVLAAAGMCGSMEAFAAVMDDMGVNRSASVPANLTWSALAVLPSANATYCATSDAACSTCYSQNASSVGSDTEGSLFCFGASGCVCLSACEPLAWAARATPVCDLSTPTPSLPLAPDVMVPETTGVGSGAHFGSSQLLLAAVQVVGVMVLLLTGIRQQFGTFE